MLYQGVPSRVPRCCVGVVHDTEGPLVRVWITPKLAGLIAKKVASTGCWGLVRIVGCSCSSDWSVHLGVDVRLGGNCRVSPTILIAELTGPAGLRVATFPDLLQAVEVRRLGGTFHNRIE